nr:hypothetical protein [Rathayibacter tritici]
MVVVLSGVVVGGAGAQQRLELVEADHGEELVVEVCLARDAMGELVASPCGGGDPDDGGEDPGSSLFETAAAVMLVLAALGDDACGVFRGEVDLEEPVVFVPVGGAGDDGEVGLEEDPLAGRAEVGTPAGRFRGDALDLEVVGVFKFGELNAEL